MNTHEIVCAKCDSHLQGSTDPKPDEIYTCPVCGVGDTYKNILDEAKAYAVEQASRGLQQALKDVVSKSKSMTYKAGHIESREYRFKLRPITA